MPALFRDGIHGAAWGSWDVHRDVPKAVLVPPNQDGLGQDGAITPKAALGVSSLYSCLFWPSQIKQEYCLGTAEHCKLLFGLIN